MTTQLRKEILYSLSLVTGDDVVAYKHGEKSAQNLSSAGFRNLTFRTYNGYLIYFCLKPKTTIFSSFAVSNVTKALILQCRLGHYTIPEETDEVCNWLTANLVLDGY